jgi:hypothetical protein
MPSLFKNFFRQKQNLKPTSDSREPLLPRDYPPAASLDTNVNHPQMDHLDTKNDFNELPVYSSDHIQSISETVQSDKKNEELNYTLLDFLNRVAAANIEVDMNNWIVALIYVQGEVKSTFGFKSQKNPICIGQIICKNIDENTVAFMMQLNNNTWCENMICIYNKTRPNIIFTYRKMSRVTIYNISINDFLLRMVNAINKTIYVVDLKQIETTARITVNWYQNKNIIELTNLAIDALIDQIISSDPNRYSDLQNIKDRLMNRNFTRSERQESVGGSVSKHKYRVRTYAVRNRNTKRHKYVNVRKMKSRMHNRKRNSKVSRKRIQ